MDKICHRCQTEKPFDAFYRQTAAADGRMRWCKECHEKASSRRKRTPAYRFNYYKANAKKKALAFTLTAEDFVYFWGKPCGYCGGAIEGIGFDRLDNAEGYTLENVIPCCSTCNAMKSRLGVIEFIHRCHLISERLYIGISPGCAA